MNPNEIKTVVGVMPVSRELLYPKPLSTEEVARLRAEREAREARQTARHQELLNSSNPVTRALADLHKPTGDYPTCRGCDVGSYAEDDPDWPCTTWELLDKVDK